MAAISTCSLVVAPLLGETPGQEDVKQLLESTNVTNKRKGLKHTIAMLLSGEDTTPLLMSVIRGCINEKDHMVKKLLVLYWESVRKVDAQGKLLPELILVVNALRNDLQHPNEYIRGGTLRFVCKIREAEILESLVDPIRQCLTHKHAYVRRNAVLAVFSLAENFGQDLMPDAAEAIAEFLEQETDTMARRNAFLMLFTIDQQRALRYFATKADEVEGFGDGFQLVLLELARKICRQQPAMKARFIRPIFAMLQSESPAVAFEAAGTLVAMSSAPTAIRAAAQAYINLLANESDNNIKMVVLDRIAALRRSHTRVLRELAVDILQALKSPNVDVKGRVLAIVADLISPRNVSEVTEFLQKEVLVTQSEAEAEASLQKEHAEAAPSSTRKGKGKPQLSNAAKYRQMLVDAIRNCAVRFPDVAQGVVLLLIEFLSTDGGVRVARLVREMAATRPRVRAPIVRKLREVMPDVRDAEVLNICLWVLGQYSVTEEEIKAAIEVVGECVGPLPLCEEQATTPEEEAKDGDGEVSEGTVAAAGGAASGPKVLQDGSYATQSALTTAEDPAVAADSQPSLRLNLLKGNYFLGSVIGSTVTKLALRLAHIQGPESGEAKAAGVDAMLLMCSILELGMGEAAPELHQQIFGPGSSMSGSTPPKEARRSNAQLARLDDHSVLPGVDQDAFEHLALCVRLLGDRSPGMVEAARVYVQSGDEAYRGLLEHVKALRASGGTGLDVSVAAGHATGPTKALGGAAEESKGGEEDAVADVDDALAFRQLRGRVGAATSAADLALDDEAEMQLATGSRVDDFSSRLQRIHQLTGLTDPVYAEAVVTVQDYDITVEMVVINRTDRTLANLNVELATVGDLRLVDRPTSHSLGPGQAAQIRSSIKVSSLESGHIYGMVEFDGQARGGGATKQSVNLAPIHVDVMEYIRPSYKEGHSFRAMWAEFEWENKVSVNTNICNLQEYVAHIIGITNMRCITPVAELASTCNFLAANLYAKSVFGEDALANLSIENRADGSIRGHIRIRSKTQGVALSLGDRITAKQKKDL